MCCHHLLLVSRFTLCSSPKPFAVHVSLCRWHAKLPDEVRAAGRCGAPCPLFWPQSPDYAPPPHSPAAPGQRRLGPLSLVGSLREAAEVLLSRAQHVTQQALRAVDWPAGEAESPEQPAGAAGAASDTAQAAGSQPARTAEFSRRQQWRVLRFALQDWVERVWQVRLGSSIAARIVMPCAPCCMRMGHQVACDPRVTFCRSGTWTSPSSFSC